MDSAPPYEKKKIVCAACNNSARSFSLSFFLYLSLLSVTTWAGIPPGWRAILAAPRRRSSLAARRSSTNADTLCQKLFLEKRVSIAIFDSTRSPPYSSLRPKRNFVNAQDRRSDATEINSLARQSCTIVSRGNSRSRLFNPEWLWQVSWDANYSSWYSPA